MMNCTTALAGAFSLLTALSVQPLSANPLQQGIQGFNDAVYNYCVTAVSGQRDLMALSGKVSKFPLQERSDGMLGVGNLPGGPAVAMEDDQCIASAFALPVAFTFDAVAQGLEINGFAEDSDARSISEKSVIRLFTKAGDGNKVIRVRLSGNEPGAPNTVSRYSTLVAFVSVEDSSN